MVVDHPSIRHGQIGRGHPPMLRNGQTWPCPPLILLRHAFSCHGRTWSGHPRLHGATASNQPDGQILPVRIAADNKPNFPSSRPVFEVLLTLNGAQQIAIDLGIDQPVKPIARRKSRSDPHLVFAHATRQVVRRADIQRPVRAVGHDVDPTGRHNPHNATERLTKHLLRTGVRRRSPDSHGIKDVDPRAEPCLWALVPKDGDDTRCGHLNTKHADNTGYGHHRDDAVERAWATPQDLPPS
jgi:hypothetical protein